jgi:hypothetical protein
MFYELLLRMEVTNKFRVSISSLIIIMLDIKDVNKFCHIYGAVTRELLKFQTNNIYKQYIIWN